MHREDLEALARSYVHSVRAKLNGDKAYSDHDAIKDITDLMSDAYLLGVSAGREKARLEANKS